MRILLFSSFLAGVSFSNFLFASETKTQEQINLKVTATERWSFLFDYFPPIFNWDENRRIGIGVGESWYGPSSNKKPLGISTHISLSSVQNIVDSKLDAAIATYLGYEVISMPPQSDSSDSYHFNGRSGFGFLATDLCFRIRLLPAVISGIGVGMKINGGLGTSATEELRKYGGEVPEVEIYPLLTHSFVF